MNIAFSEPYPILYREWKRRRELFSRGNRIRLCSAEHCRRADLILSDRNSFRASLLPLGELYLVSGEAFIEEAPAEGILLTGGMSRWDAVTFTSIGEERAMICLQREVTLLGRSVFPFEKPVFYDHRLRLYRNLALGFSLALAEQLLGEEE